jgi:hypothetical protein
MPVAVMAGLSKLFRLEHRPAEIDQQQNRDDGGDDVIEHERDSSYALSQAFVMPQSATKPRMPTTTYNRSSMRVLLVLRGTDDHDEVGRLEERRHGVLVVLAHDDTLETGGLGSH